MNNESKTEIKNTIELMNELKTKFNDTINEETPHHVEYEIYSIMEKLTRIVLVCEDFINRDEETQNIDEFNSFVANGLLEIKSDNRKLIRSLKN